MLSFIGKLLWAHSRKAAAKVCEARAPGWVPTRSGRQSTTEGILAALLAILHMQEKFNLHTSRAAKHSTSHPTAFATLPCVVGLGFATHRQGLEMPEERFMHQ